MLEELIKNLPEEPGVYRYLDAAGIIIYVGKATSLKARVKSYFTGSNNTKTQMLVASICDIQYTIVDNPTEALLLENTLIKKHQPKYNILLKDDKTYPYIKITNEEYPRVLTTRKKENDGAKYFGPFSLEGNAKILVDTINDLFPLVKLPNCGTREPCLYYHTKSCLAPCHFKVDKHEYKQYIQKSSTFFEGHYGEILAVLGAKMDKASQEMQFELAGELRDKITRIRRVKDEQKILLDGNKNVDAIAYDYKDGALAVAIFSIRKGVLIDTHVESHPIYADDVAGFTEFVERYYAELGEVPKEVYLPIEIESEALKLQKIKMTIPQRGEKKALLAMVKKNAKDALHKHIMKQLTKVDQTQVALQELKEVLSVRDVSRIEMFDNSNMGGVDAVSAMVCFTDGKPDKKEYRKYKVKTVKGANDVGTMREMILRRYSKEELPSILFVDGGLPQVRAASEVLNELGLIGNVFGIAKDDKHKSAYVVDADGAMYTFEKHKSAFRLLTQIQEEVHRFAITFFRKTHKKSAFESALDHIEGVGDKRKKMLLHHFKSVSGIKKATLSDIEALGIPRNVAKSIMEHLKKE